MIRSTFLAVFLAVAAELAAQGGEVPVSPTPTPTPTPPANPFRLEPFHADFPVELTWPNVSGLSYDRTRRQILERLASNLQGNVRREAWQFASEFWWRAPEDAVEPLIAAMDRAFGNVALGDVVKNCVEAMGKMGSPELEGALLRAIEHKNNVVRQAAFVALAKCASAPTLRRMRGWFEHMDFRATAAWIGALRQRLGDDGITMLRELMALELPLTVRDQIAKEAVTLPPAKALTIFESCWPTAKNEFKAIVAGVFHAAGDARGTTWLREAIESEELARAGLAIRHATLGDPGELRPLLLRASTHPRPEIRLEVAKALTRVDGDDVADVFEVLAGGPDEAMEIKAIALRELTRRGRDRVVSSLLEELDTATGTRLNLLLQQLADSGDPRAVPVLLVRLQKAPPEQRRPFLQSLAANRSDAATVALLDLFAGPEQIVARGHNGNHTTISYIPTLLLNARGGEERVLERFAKLAADDWQRRAALLPTMVGIATDRGDPALAERFVAPVRAIVFDRDALPQLRVLALNLLATRWLGVDDALRMKTESQKDSPAMRAFFQAFLNDWF